MSSWTDEEEDGDTYTLSPLLMSTGGRRRHSQGQHRVWMPLPHFMGLGHSMNPIPYPLQLNFPPPYNGPHSSRGSSFPISHASSTSDCSCSPNSSCYPSGNSISHSASRGPPGPPQAPVVVAGGTPDPTPPPPPVSIQGGGSVVDFDNMSMGDSSVALAPSVWAPRPHQWVLGGGFHLPDLTSLTDTVTYEMWKNTIGYFHLSGHTDELIMPITYQSIKGDVALDIVTHGPHLNLCELITCLDNNFGVVSDKDTLMKELYTIKQGPKEPIKCFDTWIGYAVMRLAVAFLHAMPTV